MPRSSTTFAEGHRSKGGRPRGSVNKVKLAARAQLGLEITKEVTREERERIRAELARDPLDPLIVLHWAMRTAVERNDEASAANYAGMLAPYLHSRLSSTDVRVTPAGVDVAGMTIAQLLAESDALRERLRDSPILLEHEP